ncbi:MAG: ATP-binding protein [Cyclobacteriaceae bacterium]
MEHIKIEIPSIPENVRIVESFIDTIKDKYHIDDNIYGNIMVSVTEAVNNAILHGNSSNKDKNVELTLALDEKKVSFTISDQGLGFDFNNLPDPTAPENIEKTGGRGIFLIRNLSDNVNFTDDGKTLKLSFNV